jgi:voltage-gated potassium channel
MGTPSIRITERTTYEGRRTLLIGLAFVGITCVVATIGYMSAGWHWIDAIYMVTITIFGVGYGEVNPIEEPWLKLFTIGVILAGCSSLVYVIGGIVQILAEGEVERMLGMRNRSRDIEQLNDHTIVCGYGRVGQMLATELVSQGEAVVIIDRETERVRKAIVDGFLALEGDAVDDDVLHRAGLFQAHTLATVLPDDATNVFITLTARDLSESIRIIARAEAPCTERKLMRSGASSVVMPAAMGAIRIAQLATARASVEAALPEDRLRMLGSTRRDAETDGADRQVEQSVENDMEELANLASDLTRKVIQRQQDQLSQPQSQSQPQPVAEDSGVSEADA